MKHTVTITKIQAEALYNAQIQVHDAERELVEARERLNLVTSLVLDSYGFDPSTIQFQVDVQNLQMWIAEPDSEIENVLENEIG